MLEKLSEEKGIDYIAMNLSEEQIYEIQIGLEKGLDVTIYTKPEYDWFQMEQIREGLELNLDVSACANS